VKTTNTKQGRPVKPPTGDLPPYIPTEARKIFEACGAPDTWGNVEFSTAWLVLMASRNPEITSCDEKTFTGMWLEARDVMLKTMPRLDRLADTILNNPQLRYVGYYCHLKELAKGPHSNAVARAARDRLDSLDNHKAEEVAALLRPAIKGLNATHVRNAREKLRHRVTFTSPR
jgi:hypothetical protein